MKLWDVYQSDFVTTVTNTWEKRFEGGKIYFSSQFRGFSPWSAGSMSGPGVTQSIMAEGWGFTAHSSSARKQREER
jgi:hypothetical protein